MSEAFSVLEFRKALRMFLDDPNHPAARVEVGISVALYATADLETQRKVSDELRKDLTTLTEGT